MTFHRAFDETSDLLQRTLGQRHPLSIELPASLWLYRVTRAQGLLGGATTEGGRTASR